MKEKTKTNLDTNDLLIENALLVTYTIAGATVSIAEFGQSVGRGAGSDHMRVELSFRNQHYHWV